MLNLHFKTLALLPAAFQLLLNIFTPGRQGLQHAGCTTGKAFTNMADYTFTAQLRDNNTALLQWQTVPDVSDSQYNIQRSNDGRMFATIGKINAVRSNGLVNEYAYPDNLSTVNHQSATIFYRLQRVGADGASTYSDVVPVRLTGNNLPVAIYPNPISDVIRIKCATAINNVTVSLFNEDGKLLYSSRKNIMADDNLTISAAGLLRGNYIVTMTTATGSNQFKLFKQ